MLTDQERTARQDRIASFDRRERIAKIATWVGIALVALLVVVFWSQRQPADAREHIVALCAPEYQRAKTAVDTAVIDRRQPFVDPTDVPAGVSCGELRRAGKIHP
jgi:hypothetical protein